MKIITVFLLLVCLSSIAVNRPTTPRRPNASINDGVIFLHDANEISSVKKLIKKFRGKPLFVDLWASWCEPCVDEFKYSADLTAWLKQESVTTLYVSYDSMENANAWKRLISQYNLSGYHMRANKELQGDFSKTIWGIPGGVNLPHYLIIDRNGNIVEKNAMNPSTTGKLRRQISKDLNLKP